MSEEKSDFSDYDKLKFGTLLYGNGDWFHAHLARLIAKADSDNKALLEKAYPNEVRFYDWYINIGVWHDSQVELDNGTYKKLMKEAGVD